MYIYLEYEANIATLTSRREAAIDNMHIVGVDVNTSGTVNVSEPDSEMLAPVSSVAKVAVERSFDGAVGSRRTGRTELLRLSTVQFGRDCDQPRAAVERDEAAVTTVNRVLCVIIITRIIIIH